MSSRSSHSAGSCIVPQRKFRPTSMSLWPGKTVSETIRAATVRATHLYRPSWKDSKCIGSMFMRKCGKRSNVVEDRWLKREFSINAILETFAHSPGCSSLQNYDGAIWTSAQGVTHTNSGTRHLPCSSLTP